MLQDQKEEILSIFIFWSSLYFKYQIMFNII